MTQTTSRTFARRLQAWRGAMGSRAGAIATGGLVVAAGLVLASCNSEQSIRPTGHAVAPPPAASLDLNPSEQGEVNPGQCLLPDVVDAGFINNPSLNCTSQDVDIAQASVTFYRFNQNDALIPLNSGDKIQCTPGQHVFVTTSAQVQNNAQARYDLGLWIGINGVNALDGTGGNNQCNHYHLAAGSGGSVNLDSPADGCGDVAASTNVDIPLGELDIVCQDDPNIAGQQVTISACAGWLNDAQPGTRDGICPVPNVSLAQGLRYGTTPENAAKCKCNPLTLPIDIRGKITIIKQTETTSGDATFAFTQDVGTNSNPQVTSPFNITTSSGTGQQVIDKVAAGTYHVTESAPPSGWEFVSANCTTGGTVSSQTATITLGPGDEVTCTFVNRKRPTLTLVKRITNDNGGTAVVGDFGITTTGGSLTFGAGVADGANTLKYTSNKLTVNAGSYSLHEGTLTGYTEGTWSCTAGTVTNTSAQSGSVTLANGQDAVCTITNNDQGASLTLVKRIVNDNGGTAVVGDFGITTTGGSLTFGSGVADGASTLKYTSNTLSVNAGAYTLHEGTLTGYTEGTWSCTAGNVTNTTAQSGSVTLSIGQTAVCTITNNDQPASLTIVKRIVNDNGGTKVVGDFGLSTTAGSLTFGAGVADGANTLKYTSTTLTGLSAGSKTLHENAVTGYTEGTWSCDVGTVTNTSATGGAVTLANGQNATCTITNDDQPATLILVKSLKGAGTTFTFNLTGSGLPSSQDLSPATDGTDSHTFSGLSAGLKSITEVVTSGYILTDLGCDDQPSGTYDPTATQTVSTTLTNGGTVTCTFVNEQHVSQTTRTQGFWATHRTLTTAVWFGGTVGGNTFTGVTDKTFCNPVTKDLSSIDRVLGGFWAGISQTTTKSKRSSLDQARMQLVQQLLAAILNNAAFGSSPSGGISIADAKAAYCGTDVNAIQAAMSAMAAFNTSGDNQTFTPGVSANGKDAKDNANLAYWDILP